MKIITTKSFDRDYQKLSEKLKDKADEKLKLFVESPKHPSLRVKKMQGFNIWEARISKGYRFTFEIQEEFCLLRRIGGHDILRKP